MIFKSNARSRRPRNTRRGAPPHRREPHLLEVKARSQTARRQRNRWLLNVACRLILLVSVAGGLYYGGYRLFQSLFFANPEYRISEITIESDGALKRDDILRIAGIRPGQNIFSVDLGRTREQLESVPQVHRAEVERHLPGVIAIRLTERKPVAWIVAPGVDDPYASPQSLLVDGRGILLKPDRLLPERLHLPLIQGLQVDSLSPGDFLDLPEVQAAIELIQLAGARTGPTSIEIQSVDLSKGYCMLAHDTRHRRHTFGLENLDWELDRLEALIGYAARERREIDTVNLLPRRNIPVVFLPAAAESPEGARTGSSNKPGRISVRKAIPVKQ